MTAPQTLSHRQAYEAALVALEADRGFATDRDASLAHVIVRHYVRGTNPPQRTVTGRIIASALDSVRDQADDLARGLPA